MFLDRVAKSRKLGGTSDSVARRRMATSVDFGGPVTDRATNAPRVRLGVLELVWTESHPSEASRVSSDVGDPVAW